MFDGLLLIVIGMFLGWNFPQPGYAKTFQNWVVSKVKNLKWFRKDDKPTS